MKFLWSDPRPDLILDSARWNRLFRLIPKLEDKSRAEQLHKTLWTMRNCGTEIKPHREGSRLVPVMGEGNAWEDQEEFEEMKRKCLSPYANEIVDLFKKLEE